MSFSKQISKISPEHFGHFAEGITQAQQMLPRAGRFLVNQAVMDAVEHMVRKPFRELLPHLNKARLPFPITWIEWLRPNGGGHLGYLCEELPGGGIAFRQYGSEKNIQQNLGFPLFCMQGRIRIEPTGWTAENPVDAEGAQAESTKAKTGINFLELAAGDILGLLLIINSPSRILEIAEGADNTRIDARRARQGRPPLPNLRAIQFDVARFQPTAPEGSLPITQADVAEHCVRGHPKIRETGVFWWSPHVRYQTGKHPVAVPTDYEVDNTAPPPAGENEGGN